MFFQGICIEKTNFIFALKKSCKKKNDKKKDDPIKLFEANKIIAKKRMKEIMNTMACYNKRGLYHR